MTTLLHAYMNGEMGSCSIVQAEDLCMDEGMDRRELSVLGMVAWAAVVCTAKQALEWTANETDEYRDARRTAHCHIVCKTNNASKYALISE